MKIGLRSVTLGVDWQDEHKIDVENVFKNFTATLKDAVKSRNIPLRTRRVVISPINQGSQQSLFSANNVLNWISSLCEKEDIRWYCVPIDATDENNLNQAYEMGLEIIKRHQNIFLNVIAAKDGIISPSAALMGARLCKSIANLSPNGFDNFRYGISANCQSGTPFFPFTHHEGPHSFSLALELPEVFQTIIREENSTNLENLRNRIVAEVSPQVKELNQLGEFLEKETGVLYKGLDASLAPLPDESHSVAKIVEMLGVESYGSNGTLFLTSYLKNIIVQILSKAEAKPVGFNGVMYSLLEDAIVCKNSNYRAFSIDSLTSFAAVCGCGVDMVPIPGDTVAEEIASLVLDVAGLSTTLEKPLGVRVLPIPHKSENEFTDFSHDFLHNARIRGLRPHVCHNYLFDDDQFRYLSPKKIPPVL